MKKKKLLILVILGAPGSGKGTQADLIAKKFNLNYFGSGEALRERAKRKDFMGRNLLKVMKRGFLVPCFIICKIWTEKMEEFKNDRNFKGCVFDGAPRKAIEAVFFDEALAWYEWHKNVKVIYINISEKESISRLTKRRMCKVCKRIIPWIGEFKKMKRCDKCNGKLIIRRDDNLTSIKKRLEEFKNEVIPVIKYYKKQGKLININGEQSIDNVFLDIIKSLK